MENNYCITSLGLNENNIINEENSITAIIELNKSIHRIDLINSLKELVKCKELLHKRFKFENNKLSFAHSDTDVFNISEQYADSIDYIHSYAHQKKYYIAEGFTYQFVIFTCNQKTYLYASFFHAIIDGIGSYSILKEFFDYLDGNLNTISYDESDGTLSFLKIDDKAELNVISGDKDKYARSSQIYKYTLDDDYFCKFEYIMNKYNITYLELSILIFMRLNYFFPDVQMGTVDGIFNLRNKKDHNKLGMYANILPLELDFKDAHSFEDMISTLKGKTFGALKNRRRKRYDFGVSNANCLISMMYSDFDNDNYSVEWVNPCDIFYNYFITIVKNKSLSFIFQVDEDISFDSQKIYSFICETIDYMYNYKTIKRLSDIKISEKIPSLSNINCDYHPSKLTIKSKLEQVLNKPEECIIIGKHRLESSDIVNFIYRNYHKFENFSVVCIKGGDFETQILIALTALYAGKSYVFISDKVPETYVDYLVESLDGTIVDASKFDIVNHDQLIQKDISFSKLPNIICYFMTSGTTGFPKLIPVKDSSIASFIDCDSSEFTKPKSVNLLTTDLSFDLSLHPLFNTLCNGGSLIIVDLSLLYKKNYIEKLILDNNVTSVLGTPSFLSLVNYDLVTNTKTVFASVGEVLPQRIAKSIIDKNLKLYNVYGPTETTCYVTEVEINKDNINSIPIGGPIKNTSMALIDGFGNLVSEECEGEIAIAGPSVFDGYVNGNGNEFITINDKRYYKTGDIAYCSKDILYFQNRKDSQIKINGYRIEINKIEDVASNLLTGHNFCVLIVKDNIILFHTSNKSNVELKRKMSQYLPKYMVPDRLVMIEKIPLTKNNKIDTEHLIALDRQYRSNVGYSNLITDFLLDLGLDLNSDSDLKLKNCGLGSMQIFALQQKLSNIGYKFNIQQLMDLKVKDLIFIKDDFSFEVREFDYDFKDFYIPSNIQNKFIVNYLKNPKTTIDNVGAVIRFNNYGKAKRFCESIKSKILNNKNFHYFVSFHQGKLLMKLNHIARINIDEIKIENETDIKQNVTNFNLMSGPLYSIKLLYTNKTFIALIEFHHIVIDGISIKELINSSSISPIPYHNYKKVLSWDESVTDNHSKYFRDNIFPFLDDKEYFKKEVFSISSVNINRELIKKLSYNLKVNHESIFATAYAHSMELSDVILCTPVNVRNHPDDNYITGPLVDLSLFRVSCNSNFIDSICQTNDFFKSSIDHPFMEPDKVVNSDSFMTHLLTIFESYGDIEDGCIDYELSNTIYDDKFKINTYIYENKDTYTVYLYSRYLSKKQIDVVLQNLKKIIEENY